MRQLLDGGVASKAASQPANLNASSPEGSLPGTWLAAATAPGPPLPLLPDDAAALLQPLVKPSAACPFCRASSHPLVLPRASAAPGCIRDSLWGLHRTAVCLLYARPGAYFAKQQFEHSAAFKG